MRAPTTEPGPRTKTMLWDFGSMAERNLSRGLFQLKLSLKLIKHSISYYEVEFFIFTLWLGVQARRQNYGRALQWLLAAGRTADTAQIVGAVRGERSGHDPWRADRAKIGVMSKYGRTMTVTSS